MDIAYSIITYWLLGMGTVATFVLINVAAILYRNPRLRSAVMQSFYFFRMIGKPLLKKEQHEEPPTQMRRHHTEEEHHHRHHRFGVPAAEEPEDQRE